MISQLRPDPIMVLGTSSGAGKSLITAAICRVLLRKGEDPLPFKGQNMSNNAWVDQSGGEMAYSQAVQAWAAGLEPKCAMNPVLLKPKGDHTSELIHMGKSVGIARAESYYEDWFLSGWSAIRNGLNELRQSHQRGRFVLEGAGSPVEVNLQRRDLTNLRLATFLRARCLLVADIERGGVFAQVIGTLALMQPFERSLIRGLLINRFRGRPELFEEGRSWLEKETGIPVLGVMPWLKENFPPEDSLDLLERKSQKPHAEIEIAVIKLPSLSNFSDLDPLEAEPSVQLRWVEAGDQLGLPDAVLIPGSKQTISDLAKLFSSGLADQIKTFAYGGGSIFGICGGMQMLGRSLWDPLALEGAESKAASRELKGLDLLPLKTVFDCDKSLLRQQVILSWPSLTSVAGFELHHGKTEPVNGSEGIIEPISNNSSIGWVVKDKSNAIIAGTYLHGIFENGSWRRLWLNLIREKKGFYALPIDEQNHSQRREEIIDLLADSFEEHIDLTPILDL